MQATRGEAAMMSPSGDMTDEPKKLMVRDVPIYHVSTSRPHLFKLLTPTLLVQAFALILRTKVCLLRDLGKYVR